MNRFRFLDFYSAVRWDGAAAPAAAPAAPVEPAAAAPAAAAPATLVAAAAAVAPVAPAAAATPATPAASGAAAAPYIPEGLPETLRGSNDKETLDKIAQHLGALPKPPEKPDGYKTEPAKEIAGMIDTKNDKVLPIFQKVAHELGLSQAQYNGVINGVYGQMMQAGMIAAPVQIEAEFGKLGGQGGDKATQIQRGMERINTLAGQITGLATRQVISAAEASALTGMVASADAAIAVERILAMIPSAGGPRNGGGGGASPEAQQEAALAAMYPSMKRPA